MHCIFAEGGHVQSLSLSITQCHLKKLHPRAALRFPYICRVQKHTQPVASCIPEFSLPVGMLLLLPVPVALWQGSMIGTSQRKASHVPRPPCTSVVARAKSAARSALFKSAVVRQYMLPPVVVFNTVWIGVPRLHVVPLYRAVYSARSTLRIASWLNMPHYLHYYHGKEQILPLRNVWGLPTLNASWGGPCGGPGAPRRFLEGESKENKFGARGCGANRGASMSL